MRSRSLGIVFALLASVLVAVLAPTGTANAASCSVTGPIHPRVFVPASPEFQILYVTFSSTNNRGLFAGVANDGLNQFAVVTYRGGVFKVLDRIGGYTSWDWNHLSFGGPQSGSVRVMGVSAAGAVIVAVQRPGTSWEQNIYDGYKYEGGRKYKLAASSAWQSVEPAGVSASGVVVGSVRIGGDSHIMKWTGPGSGGAKFVSGPDFYDPRINARGDIVYSKAQTSITTVKLADGRTTYLSGVTANVQYQEPQAVGGDTFYGRIRGNNIKDTLVKWQAPSAASALPMRAQPIGYYQAIEAAGSGGAVVVRVSSSTRWLITNAGRKVGLPYGTVVDNIDGMPLVVDPGGAVILTAPDGTARIFRCNL